MNLSKTTRWNVLNASMNIVNMPLVLTSPTNHLVSLRGYKCIVKTNHNNPEFQVILTLMLVVKKQESLIINKNPKLFNVSKFQVTNDGSNAFLFCLCTYFNGKMSFLVCSFCLNLHKSFDTWLIRYYGFSITNGHFKYNHHKVTQILYKTHSL